jgi:recombination protein RecA
MAKATKKAKTVTNKVTPKRKGEGKAKKATQLQVMLEAREYLQKKHGKGAVRLMNEVDSTIPGYVSTQSLALDKLVGNGGVAQSRMVEIYGPEGIGKSTISDHLIAQVQARGGVAYLWDTENARDHRYMDQVGIVRGKAIRVEADTVESGYAIAQETIDWHLAHHPELLGIWVWDTVAGTPTEAELDPAKKNERYGPAKMIRGMCRVLTQSLKKSRWIFVVVNQTYITQQGHFPVVKTYGGEGIPYYASLRLECGYRSPQWRTPTAKTEGEDPIGQVIIVRSAKNKVYPPLRSEKIFIRYGEGIDNTWTLFETLTDAGMIVQSGGWYEADWPEIHGKYPKWQGGYDTMKRLCAENAELWKDLILGYQDLEARR